MTQDERRRSFVGITELWYYEIVELRKTKQKLIGLILDVNIIWKQSAE